MAIQLLIIAEEEPFLPPFKTARDRAVEVPREFYVRTCKSPDDLLKTVHAVALLTGQRIDVLDIFGHGAPGAQFLGKDVLFSANTEAGVPRLETGADIARGLKRFLMTDAQVRLLGCKTALDERGQALLLSLHAELGDSVVVYGTIALADAYPRPPTPELDPSEFGERGFRDIREEDWLFSSTEARLRLAPDQSKRVVENQIWYAGVRDP